MPPLVHLSRFNTSFTNAAMTCNSCSSRFPILWMNRSRSRATIWNTRATLSRSRPLCGEGDTDTVWENLIVRRFVVNGTTTTRPFACPMIKAGRSPPCSCPLASVRSTSQISPRLIRHSSSDRRAALCQILVSFFNSSRSLVVGSKRNSFALDIPTATWVSG